MTELERRLRARSTDSDEVIARRLSAARSEIELGADQYDYIIVNDDLEVAVLQLEAVVAHELARRAGNPEGAAGAVVEGLQRGRLDVRPWLT
jgi:guanylate kinase